MRKVDISKACVEKNEHNKTYLMRTKINGKKCFVCTEFYNDILIGVSYSFFEKSTEVAYKYAKQIRTEISKVYGEPTDNPIIFSDKQKSLDDLKNYSEIANILKGVLTSYSEDWLIQKDSVAAIKSSEGYPIRQTDMRIDFTCIPNDSARIEVRHNLFSAEKLSKKERGYIE